MTDYATPRHDAALAEMLDHIAYSIRTGRDKAKFNADQLRRIADILERVV